MVVVAAPTVASCAASASAVATVGGVAAVVAVIVAVAIVVVVVVGIQGHHNGNHLILYAGRLAITVLGTIGMVALDPRRRERQVVRIGQQTLASLLPLIPD